MAPHANIKTYRLYIDLEKTNFGIMRNGSCGFGNMDTRCVIEDKSEIL